MQIIPNQFEIEVLYSEIEPVGLCPDSDFAVDIGIEELKDFNYIFNAVSKSDKYKSYNNWFIDREDYIFERHNKNNNSKISKYFTKIGGKLLIDLNTKSIKELYRIPVTLPDNCYVTIRVKVNDSFYLDSGHWNESKIIQINDNTKEKYFCQDCNTGTWWFE